MKLEIDAPRNKTVPSPNVTLTFCVDTSGSMKETAGVIDNSREVTRQEAVKQGMRLVISGAQKQIDSDIKSKIQIAIVGFGSSANVIYGPGELETSAQGRNKRYETIEQTIKNYVSEGSTNLHEGLDLAIQQIEKMHKSNPNAKHVFILLTDGDSNLTDTKIKNIREDFLKRKTVFYAIGIGKNHSNQVLRQLVDSRDNDKFKGHYIDAGNDLANIPKEVNNIFIEQLNSVYNFKLESNQEIAGQWSVGSERSGQKTPELDLGQLSSGKMVKYIKINSKYLKQPLDLNSVKFRLISTGPDGKRVSFPLPWKINSVINPAIAKEAKQKKE